MSEFFSGEISSKISVKFLIIKKSDFEKNSVTRSEGNFILFFKFQILMFGFPCIAE